MGIGSLNDIFQPRLFSGECVKVCIRLGIGGIDGFELLMGLLDITQTIFDIAAHILVRIKVGLLRQVPDADTAGGAGLADKVSIDTGHDSQQGRLARAVIAEYANFCAGEEVEIDVLEDFFFRRYDLAEAVHGKDILSHLEFCQLL